jgi:hypothetical protein
MVASTPAPSKPPSFKPLWKAPKQPISNWPPHGANSAYRVQDADNWGTVASLHKFPDPWDIIIFNFRTDNPEEVNWYMHHYIGCTESNDGKNFSFRGAEFRQIYIPTHDWLPEREFKRGSFNYRLIAKAVVRDLDSIIPRLKGLKYGRYILTPFHYRELQDKIRSGQLLVRFDPMMKNHGLYQNSNVLSLKYYRPGAFYDKTVLVHELAHAVFDLESYEATGLDLEITARAMAGIYIYGYNGAWFEKKVLAGTMKKDPWASAIHFIGYVMWKHFRDRHLIDLHELDRLFWDPIYAVDDNPLLRLANSVRLHPGYNFGNDVKWWQIQKGDGI